jgi:hypothetical protein
LYCRALSARRWIGEIANCLKPHKFARPRENRVNANLRTESFAAKHRIRRRA